jgi:rare lipoprotein A
MMKRILCSAIVLCCALPVVADARAAAISRRDGFLLVWSSILRPAEDVRSSGYEDVPKGAVGYKEITYAKARGFTIDGDHFSPDAPLVARDAVIWLLRTRNLEPIDAEGNKEFLKVIEPEDAPILADKYSINGFEPDHQLTKSELEQLIVTLDTKLRTEVHEASLYSEKFHGKGTAFGETFDMHALTAAHRSYPHNTMVKVTNTENGKSVVVRINDRGPFVQGRDMDLSLGSFLRIAERSKGRIDVTFERLGDASLVQPCGNVLLQRRITRDVLLSPGIPGTLALGSGLKLTASRFFVVRGIRYPDADWQWMQQWIEPGETYELTPSVAGVYELRLGSASGKERTYRMEVAECAG